MRFTIPHVEHDIEPEAFRAMYYLPRRPVVIRGAALDWPARTAWTAQRMEGRIAAAPDAASRQPLWWDVDPALVAHEIHTPPVVEHLIQMHRPAFRRRCLRVWVTHRGKRTPWHYDGNSVDVFNVQVTGRKRFTLVSPATPIACAPFSIVGRQPLRPPEALLDDRHRFTTFELSSGDMLFLPRHWSHYVESLEEENTNLNWVWTDLGSGPDHYPCTRRERELVGLAYPLFRAHGALARLGLPLSPLRVSQLNEAYVREYGGEDAYAVARRFRASTGTAKLLARAGLELLSPRGEPITG